MYTVSDVVEMGDARELILLLHKDEFVFDDAWPQTMPPDESFDE